MKVFQKIGLDCQNKRDNYSPNTMQGTFTDSKQGRELTIPH